MSSRFATVLAVTLIVVVPGVGQSTNTQQSERSKAREFWNEKFRSGLPNVRREPSRVLVEAVAQYQKPGSALDLGCGDGRNLLYLSERGWRGTGVDISEVAIDQAKSSANARNLTAEFLVSDLDAFDLGQNRWDLLSSIYMQDWHIKSGTNTFSRMKTALKPGGLVVIEGFGPPNGLNLDNIKREFDGFTILRADIVSDDPDWGHGRGTKQILRFVARKSEPSTP
jgi:SAM-dependent methyltransferase